jgi:NTP pyrophosphatase (non-canonical NTP hydrolase)
MKHAELVEALVKPPEAIRATLSVGSVDLIHAIMGISGEAGELLDGIKKHVIYNKPLDIENVIEELGDMEFYMEQLRQRLGITREQTIEHNIAKLSKRYASLGYSDAAAQERADKQ